MATNFEQIPRAQHERKARPLVERIIGEAFAAHGMTVSHITWTDTGSELGMAAEKIFGIDGAIYFADGQKLTFQAKALQERYATFATMTIEHYNDPALGKKGDWFNCIAQIYVCGYASHDYQTMMPWVVVNYPSLKMAAQQGRVKWRGNGNHKTQALASFRYTPIANLPDDVVIARRLSEFDNVAEQYNAKA